MLVVNVISAVIILYLTARSIYIFCNRTLLLGLEILDFCFLSITQEAKIMFWAFFNYKRYKIFCRKLAESEKKYLSIYPVLIRQAYRTARLADK